MQRKHIVLGVAVAAGLLALSSYASPYWTLSRLRDAAAAHDGQAVSGYVDFPALRDSFKVQLLAAVAERAASKGEANSPFAALAPALIAAVANPLIDAMVSPAGVTAMLASGEVNMARPSAPPPAGDEVKPKADWSLHYRNWNQVAVTMDVPGAAGFIFRRDGLWSWKLAAVELPRDASR
jgi:hypothetical protein